MRSDFKSERIFCLSLDFSHQAEPRLKSVFPRLPACGTYLPAMLGNKLRGLYFSKEFFGAPANAIIVYFNRLNYSFGVNNESPSKREPFFFYVRTKHTREISRRVRRHRKLYLSHRRRCVMPCLVRKNSVSAHAHDFYPYFFELFIIIRHLFKLSGADKGKVCRIKEEHKPFSFKFREVYFSDFFIVIYLKCMLGYAMPHFYTTRKCFCLFIFHIFWVNTL